MFIDLEESKTDLVALSDAESSISTGNDYRDLGELRYERILQEKHKNMERSIRMLPEFETICRTFLPPRLKLPENIIKFWKDNKNTYPSLYPLAEVTFAVPRTQVSVERLFSQLRFILNCLRGNLLSDNTNNVLLVLANAHLILYEYVEEHQMDVECLMISK